MQYTTQDHYLPDTTESSLVAHESLVTVMEPLSSSERLYIISLIDGNTTLEATPPPTERVREALDHLQELLSGQE